MRLMGLENSKAAHHIRVCPDSDTKITHIGWSWNDVGRPGLVSAKTVPSSWRDELSKGLDFGQDGPSLDLPKELTFLEVDTALPKISPLPGASAGDG